MLPLRVLANVLVLFVFLTPLPRAAAEPAALRIAALDWGAVELILGLGLVPVAVTQPEGYNRAVVAPTLPPSVVDLGLVVEPNLELLASLKPDIILGNPLQVAAQGDLLRRIAPTEAVSANSGSGSPYEGARAETRRLAARLGRDAEGEALEARTDALLEAASRACPGEGRAVYLIWIVDHRNVVVYGTKSLFQPVLDRMGLVNGWTGPTNGYGFAVVGVEQLAGVSGARFIHIGPVQSDAARALADSRLWQSLPALRERPMATLAPVWFYGGLPAIGRFATLMADLVREECHRG
ncbi:ABC transporter substrate-binding protein [uncultured Methylobacterium sp.]|uniref:ABC transporter substrate-binding protein n=1 Tax=uncultured Methylobacterium sp. TaxID=157278 RepID=UPI0035CC5D88